MAINEMSELEKTLQEKFSGNEVNSMEDLAELLTDDQLADISAGYRKMAYSISSPWKTTYYKWKEGDFDNKFLCPNCGMQLKGVFFGTWYRCNMCMETWINEDKLKPNMKYWVEISKSDYDKILEDEKSDDDFDPLVEG